MTSGQSESLTEAQRQECSLTNALLEEFLTADAVVISRGGDLLPFRPILMITAAALLGGVPPMADIGTRRYRMARCGQDSRRRRAKRPAEAGSS